MIKPNESTVIGPTKKIFAEDGSDGNPPMLVRFLTTDGKARIIEGEEAYLLEAGSMESTRMS